MTCEVIVGLTAAEYRKRELAEAGKVVVSFYPTGCCSRGLVYEIVWKESAV